MKKWIGLLFVSLLLGMSLLAPLGKTPQVSATSPSYTFYVRAFDILNNTTVPNVEIIVRDIATGASVGKTTNSAGLITVNIPSDFGGSYSDGDTIVIEGPQGGIFTSGLIWIHGSINWNGKFITLKLYPPNAYNGGTIGLSDRTPYIRFNTPPSQIVAGLRVLSISFTFYYSTTDTGSGLSPPAQPHTIQYYYYVTIWRRTPTGSVKEHGTTTPCYQYTITPIRSPTLHYSSQINLTVLRPGYGTYYYYFRAEVRWREINVDTQWHVKSYTSDQYVNDWKITWLST